MSKHPWYAWKEFANRGRNLTQDPKRLQKGRSKLANLHDVAREAEVSVTTASRALNGHRDVSEQTRARVLAVSRALDYQPSQAARSLVMGRSRMVGIQFVSSLQRTLSSPFIMHVVNAFASEVGTLGYDIIWLTAETEELRATPVSARARRREVEGIFTMLFDPQDPALSDVYRLDIPVVMLDLDLVGPNVRFVASDHVRGAQLALEHLRSLGHTRIGLIVSQVGSLAGRERLLSYRQTLAAMELAYRPEWVVVLDDYRVEDGARGMQTLIERGELPTALFVGGDYLAIGATQACARHGIRIPQDLSVVGFDGLAEASFVTPPLTTVRQDTECLGRTCARLLVEAVQDGGARDVARIPVELVVGSSTAPVSERGRE